VTSYVFETNDDYPVSGDIVTDMSVFESFFALSGELLAITRHDGTLRCTNPAWQKILGYSPDELAGTSIVELTSAEDKKRVADWLGPQLALSSPAVTARMRGKDGVVRPFLLHLHQGPEIGEFYLIGQQYEDGGAAMASLEASLHELQNRWHAVTTALPDIVITSDREARVVSQNRQPPALEHVPNIGRLMFEPVPPGDREALEERFQQVLQTGALVDYELRVNYPDGSEGRFSSRLAPIFDGQEVTGSVCITREITQQWIAEVARRAAEDRWRSLAEHAPDTIFTIDSRGTIQSINRPMAGIDVDEPLGAAIFEFAMASEREAVRAAVDQVLTTGVMTTYRTSMRAQDGSTRWFENRMGPLRKDGAIIGAVIIATDITEAKLTQDRLAEQTRLLKAMMDNIGDGVVIVDEGGAIKLHNPAGERLLGAGPVVAAPHRWTETYGICELDRVTPVSPETLPLSRAIAGEVVEQTELFVRHSSAHDGKFIEISARPLYESNGSSCGAVAIFRDISQRKLAEEEHARLVAIIEATTDLVGITGADHRFIYMNEACRQAAALDQHESISRRTLADLQPPEAAAELMTVAIPKAIEHGTWSGETVFRSRHSEFAASLVIIAHKSLRGELQYLSLVSRDISERQAQEQRLQEYTAQLERSNRELERFASVASHDLQEPLRKIQAFSGRLKQKLDAQLPELSNDYLGRIEQAARRMQNLINDLLMYSRIATAEHKYVRVNLTAVAHQVISDLEIRIEETGGSVDIGTLPTIEADQVHMRQLFQNLVANALKFHRPGVPPTVTLTANLVPSDGPATEPPLCRIVIADNGIGIERKYYERIFSIFERLHSRGEYEGTGIGLAVCRKIVEQHGGRIEIDSVVGQGTTFTILLPSAKPRKKS
jgi:PAS domain S-box-containing protein